MNTQKIVSCIGLCKRAGKLIIGTPAICEALSLGDFAAPKMRNKIKKPVAVFEASDVSANTSKKLADKCGYHKIELIILPISCGELAAGIGKTGDIAAVAISDKGMCEMVKKALSESDGEKKPTD